MFLAGIILLIASYIWSVMAAFKINKTWGIINLVLFPFPQPVFAALHRQGRLPLLLLIAALVLMISNPPAQLANAFAAIS